MTMRWLVHVLGCLLVAVAVSADACPICFRGMALTTAQQLSIADRAVLAVPSTDGKSLDVVETIKGGGNSGETIAGDVPALVFACGPEGSDPGVRCQGTLTSQ